MRRSGVQASEAVVEIVGYIRVDLDTPTPVLREFVRRFCGGWLNENAKVGRARQSSRLQCVVHIFFPQLVWTVFYLETYLPMDRRLRLYFDFAAKTRFIPHKLAVQPVGVCNDLHNRWSWKHLYT